MFWQIYVVFLREIVENDEKQMAKWKRGRMEWRNR